MLAIAAFAGQGFVLMGAAAVSSPTPTPAPTPAPAPAPAPTSKVAANFSISAPSFSPTNAVRLDGVKDAGSSVVVSPLSAGGEPLCSIPASSATDWSCVTALPHGKGITLSAVETLNGTATATATTTLDVLGAPSIDGSPGYLTSGLLSGYALPGATVIVSADAGGASCNSTATAAGYWSCSLAAPSGDYVVRATQSRADLGNGASSSPSGSLSIVIDKNAPAVPAITSPPSGARVTTAEVTFSGTGESGAVADLYLDALPACQTAVVNGLWSCSVRGVSAGAHTLLVIQRDAAGNYSAPSAPISVLFGAETGATAPTNPPSPGSKASAPPANLPPVAPAPEPSTTPPPAAKPPAAGRSDIGQPDNWGTPTRFGSEIPALASSVTAGNWPLAPLLALAFVLLIALPLRLLSTALRGRIRAPSVQLMGRNRGREARAENGDAAKPINPWLAGAVPLVAAAALIVVAGGVNDQARYLRLSVGVALGLAILNVVGVAVATRLGARSQGVSGRLRFLPILMLAAVLAATLTRAAGLQPPIVAGVLIGVGFAAGVSMRSRAIVSLVEIGAVTALAATAWVLRGAMGPVDGFWASLAGETLATVALAGAGSVVVLVLPIATLPGRTVFEWSRPAWLGTVAVVALVGSVMVLGAAGGSFPLVGSIVLAAAFAALSVAVWGWLRFVEPDPADAGL